jgi:hypothetical protein
VYFIPHRGPAGGVGGASICNLSAREEMRGTRNTAGCIVGSIWGGAGGSGAVAVVYSAGTTSYLLGQLVSQCLV